MKFTFRCIGCKGCQVACKMENGTALGCDRIKVREVGPTGTYPNLEMYFLPTMCQQCENPSCVEVCPTGAMYQNPEDGVVLIDNKKCIGCQSCNKKCPYNATTFNEISRTMDKCTLCANSRAEGEVPACVKNCSGKALNCGDIDDPQSKVSKMIQDATEAGETIFSIRDFGNNPSTKYILKNAKWQDVLPLGLDEVSSKKGYKSL
ncbi:4Fe-4S ferredoxin [Candidatus Epulonipiscium fishelsonii]|uniref:4Fe-4S ferredoxin n=1 Tax=Candidatus Epulonipiscium fishelsonii TaxID=77094 RepID=A0ACC8X9V4_9FIRM|nr:4Fe-4S ferredoxin [Epulopiscium sp. SCG-B11WGA-EpuloA1]ONI41710.1 4Fe-4S ferredoxin [Epulopiscium sp. SCG-B05WGA-EpuloA1]